MPTFCILVNILLANQRSKSYKGQMICRLINRQRNTSCSQQSQPGHRHLTSQFGKLPLMGTSKRLNSTWPLDGGLAVGSHWVVMSEEPLQATQAISDLVTKAIPDDERLWVPQADKIWFRPLILNTTNGEWVNLLRIAKGGVMNRHRHPAPVYGYVLKGEWRYLEHDWVAKPGTFVFEPPGEIHTLVVDEEVEEMITLFHVFGALVYYDEDDNLIQHDDVHTKIEMCRAHFEQVGLGADYVKQFIR